MVCARNVLKRSDSVEKSVQSFKSPCYIWSGSFKEYGYYRNCDVRAGVMAHWVERSLSKHQDFLSNTQNPGKKLGVAALLRETETGGTRVLTGQSV